MRDTCFFISFQKRDLNFVKVLVALGANVNYADSKGNTALDIAVQSGSSHIAELLRRVGGLPYDLLDQTDRLNMDTSTSESDDEMRSQSELQSYLW